MKTMILYKKIVYGLLLCVLFGSLSAGTTRAQNRKIGLKGKAFVGSAVKLRWAPDTSSLWLKGNRYGYRVIRKIVGQSDSTVFIVKPATYQKFQDTLQRVYGNPPTTLGTRDSLKYQNHYVMAGALYGSISSDQSSQGFTVVAPTTPQDTNRQKYTLALLAAELSYKAATMGGLGYTDLIPISNPLTNTYIYRIMLVDSSITGTGRITFSDTIRISMQNLPKPPTIPSPSIKGGGNKTVSLKWKVSTAYTSYWILRREKSTFAYDTLNIYEPLLNLESADSLYYQDNVPLNNKSYVYRILGKTLFDEYSGSGEVEAITRPDYRIIKPRIENVIYQPQGTVNLNWSFPVTYDSLPEGPNNSVISVRLDTFYLNRTSAWTLSRSPNGTNNFQQVGGIMAKSQQSIIIDPTTSTNSYYRIGAVLTTLDTLYSPVALIQAVDSLPPAPPQGLRYEFLSSGIGLDSTKYKRVKVSWNPNTEADILGYRVFRSFISAKEDPSQLTKDISPQAFFIDTIQIANLNKNVYYFVMAVDQRFNQSGYSTPLKVVKPDKIPPTAPVLIGYAFQNNGVKLWWVNSPDDDIVSHKLLKRDLPQDTTWRVVQTFTSIRDTLFVDTDAKSGRRYAYSLLATDQAGNTRYSKPLLIQVPVGTLQETVLLNAFPNRQLQQIELGWSYNNPAIAEFQFYRADSDAPLSFWRVESGDARKSLDRVVKPSTTYKYSVRAILNDGSQTSWREITVTFPSLDCINKFYLLRNTAISQNTIDKACDEIDLEDGFEVPTSVDYEGLIGEN